MIFTLYREKLSKFVSCQNKLKINDSSTGICLLCNIYMSLLKVTFFAHFFFLESLNNNAFQCHLNYNIEFFLCLRALQIKSHEDINISRYQCAQECFSNFSFWWHVSDLLQFWRSQNMLKMHPLLKTCFDERFIWLFR